MLDKELLQDERRMLHAVYRVGNLDDTIEYILNARGVQIRVQPIQNAAAVQVLQGALWYEAAALS